MRLICHVQQNPKEYQVLLYPMIASIIKGLLYKRDQVQLTAKEPY